MQAYRVKKIVKDDGRVELEALPFPAGEEVEIIVLTQGPTTGEKVRPSLRGSVLEYVDPTQPVAEDDWHVLS